MDDLYHNYMALLEAILSTEEVLPDLILHQYGLIELRPKELREMEAMEMKRLYRENWTYQQIADKFHMTDSGVYRRMQRYGG